ncbi:TIGR00266 family protein [Parvularcula sp. IMCC14364]|uniref:TIGR00266 family protein n=1 Tax=Parvularcula sp. IMCC14364 TaxID=3067902 RepID=UPI003556EDF8
MWYYITDSNQRKQAHADELPLLEEQGAIKPSTLMWTDGMADWQPASEVRPELFDDKPDVNLPSIPAKVINSDVVDYDILGDDMQIVEVELDPGEVVIAEAGAMNYVEEGITFDTRMGDGSNATESGIMGIIKNIGSRVLTGESIFMTHFTHEGQGKKRVAFAAPYPGKIIPVDLSQIGGELICQKDSFLCAARGTKLSIAFNKKFGAGLFGGEGFILQRLQGDGMAFVHAGGTVVKKELKGETLRVDTGCLVAFAPTVEYDIERAGNLKSMIFGGEGLFLATLKGHGTVYLQSLPFARLADRIAGQIAPGGRRQGEGSLLGGVGNLLDGDGR